MVGYGPEDNHFVIELTYNYGLGSYNLGNDFLVSIMLYSTFVNKIKVEFMTYRVLYSFKYIKYT